MKKISYFLLFIATTFWGCEDMDAPFKQYVVPGGIVYPAKPTNPVAMGGRNRIKIAWARGSDASVKTAKIYWNNKQDSISLDVSSVTDTVSTIISNLQERQYSFILYTYNSKGNSSVPVELLGESFGTRYESSLLARPIITSETDASGALIIEWGSANTSSGAYATDVKYTNTSNNLVTKRFLVSESSSKILDYKPGTNYQYCTVYSPGASSIDLFYTPFITGRVSYRLNKSNWLATTDSYALTSKLPNGPPAMAIDNNLTTYWHTETVSTKTYPHWLAVDLKKPATVTRIELSCVQDNAATSTFTAFTLQTSPNGTTWNNAATFTLILKNGTQSFLLPVPVSSQYVRLYATVGASYFASLAEFSVIGYE